MSYAQEVAKRILQDAKAGDTSYIPERVEQLVARIEKLETSLRNAPMPYRESTLAESWDDYYDDWWHMNASEEALGG